jgi:hypothetical protein
MKGCAPLKPQLEQVHSGWGFTTSFDIPLVNPN